MDADVVEYLGAQDSEDHYQYKYDDILLSSYRSIINNNDSLQLIFLHLMGSHFQYHNRYPAKFQKFSASDILSCIPRKWLDKNRAQIVVDYDSSIVYTDSLLRYLIKEIADPQVPTVLIYLSDHGENVYDDRDYRGRDNKFVRVPFILYPNSAYCMKNPEIIESLSTSLSKPFSTSELPQILLHLTGTEAPQYFPKHDVLSENFKKRKRFVDGAPFVEDK